MSLREMRHAQRKQARRLQLEALEDRVVLAAAVLTPVVGLTLDEGQTLAGVLATFTEVGSTPPHSATVNWGDGSATEPAVVDEALNTVAGTQEFLDSGQYSALVTITNAATESSSVNVLITVNNVGPTAEIIDAPSTTVRGKPNLFTFAATDPSPADLAKPMTYHIDWNGDGTVDQMIKGPAEGVTVEHIFPVETENVTVIVTATDIDGDTGPAATHDVEVKVFDLVFNEDGEEDIEVGGTFGGDRIVASQLFGGAIQVRINSKFYKLPDATGRLVIYGQGGVDSIVIAGNVGYDTVLYGGAGSDYIAGGRYRDTLYGDAGNDRLIGSDGENTFHGGAGNDFITGGRRADIAFGDAGNDVINGGSGNDILDGGDGNDRITGGDGDDIVRGGPGNDMLRGDRGADILIGQDGNDRLFGNAGRDILIGGFGADNFYGGLDDDLFIHGALDIEDDDEELSFLLLDWLEPFDLFSRIELLSDRLNADTIQRDNAIDIMSGERDEDWFLTETRDKVRDLRSNDVREDIYDTEL